MTAIKVGASLLSANYGRLEEEIEKLEKAGVDFLSFDVMDGHFVDNISFGPAIVGSLRGVTKLPFEAHLMVEHPEKFVPAFVDAGCDMLTVHVEAARHPEDLIASIRKDARAGLAISPETPAERILPFTGVIDMALIMTVKPGFGGQRFIDQSGKIRQVRAAVGKEGAAADIGVDGGVNDRTAKVAVAAGANVLVAGSFITGQPDYRDAVRKLRGL
ncbi:MAG: ribulose-phosphate 3-epimerase [Candidatus Aenigmarchaeota archaeon]|nr:ribulose-phosphate 3-epimerase [Candidatus Aenigmarchaeota archaeon]